MRSASFIVLAWIAACGSTLEVSERTYIHMLSVDENGRSVPLQVKGTDGVREDLDEHADLLVAEIRRALGEKIDAGEEARILMMIHGGLISREAALEEAGKYLQHMEGEDFHPIFINWETGFGRSYYDHMFRVRGGVQAPWTAKLTSPFYLVADLGRALTRLPVTYWKQGSKPVKELFVDDEPTPPPEGWTETVWLDQSDEKIPGERTETIITGVFPGAARVVTTFVLDAAGKSAYVNMLRRARVLFLWDENMEPRSNRKAKVREQSGALSRLMEKLREEFPVDDGTATDYAALEESLGNLQRELLFAKALHPEHALQDEPCADCLEVDDIRADIETTKQSLIETRPLRITIIAHSMGTIVANELVRRNPDFVFDDIVYMAAACSIKDFADTTLVYVKEHPATSFYNLCLHPYEDEADRYGDGILPFGSLLVWIDDYVTDWKSKLDGTLGRWNNIVDTLPVIDYLTSDVRERIVVTGFGRGPDVPRTHGDFNDVRFRFWEPSFWDWRLPHEVDPEEPPSERWQRRHHPGERVTP